MSANVSHLCRHWDKIGDAALGKHIKDFKPGNGAYDAFNLPGPDKLLNAQNYAFLGAVSLPAVPA
jgi:hypothetical protein